MPKVKIEAEQNYAISFYGVPARDVPRRLKPEGFISFIAGLKTCSTPLWGYSKT
jgi:hypothetical protein